jgi:hypothetical protein
VLRDLQFRGVDAVVIDGAAAESRELAAFGS